MWYYVGQSRSGGAEISKLKKKKIKKMEMEIVIISLLVVVNSI